jgi:HD-like signal output (HDOD) protein
MMDSDGASWESRSESSMRVLLVDSDHVTHDALRQHLAGGEMAFVITLATSVGDGLGRLGVVPYDVVIVNSRFATAEAIVLLEQVAKRFPEAVRIYVNCQNDESALGRVLRVAHQVIRYPVDASLLHALILQTASLVPLLTDTSMRRALGGLSHLPAQPKLYRELSQLIANPNCSTDEVVRLLGRDSNMTAKLLQLANSSFFQRRANITELRSAVVRLGVNTIRNLLLSLELYEPGSATARALGHELEAAQAAAFSLAQMAEQLAKGTRGAGEAFVAGLLADIGQVVFILTRGIEWKECRLASKREQRPLQDLEVERFGVSHAEVGAYLLGLWGLPHSLVEAVANHHRPDRIVAPLFSASAITAIAAALLEGTPLSDEWLFSMKAKTRVDLVRSSMLPAAP